MEAEAFNRAAPANHQARVHRLGFARRPKIKSDEECQVDSLFVLIQTPQLVFFYRRGGGMGQFGLLPDGKRKGKMPSR